VAETGLGVLAVVVFSRVLGFGVEGSGLGVGGFFLLVCYPDILLGSSSQTACFWRCTPDRCFNMFHAIDGLAGIAGLDNVSAVSSASRTS